MNISIIFLSAFFGLCGLTLSILYSREIAAAISSRLRKKKGGKYGDL